MGRPGRRHTEVWICFLREEGINWKSLQKA